jgi:hypothetical protein
MRVSQAQLDVWKARAKLDRKLARMTRAQQQAYFDGVFVRIQKKFGIDLHLREADPPNHAASRRPRAIRPKTQAAARG